MCASINKKKSVPSISASDILKLMGSGSVDFLNEVMKSRRDATRCIYLVFAGWECN